MKHTCRWTSECIYSTFIERTVNPHDPTSLRSKLTLNSNTSIEPSIYRSLQVASTDNSNSDEESLVEQSMNSNSHTCK